MIRGSDSLWLVNKTDANRNPKNKKDPHIIVQIALMGKDLEKLPSTETTIPPGAPILGQVVERGS